MVWAVPVSLAAIRGIARIFFLIVMANPKTDPTRKKIPFLLSIPPATLMFHFTGCAPSYKGTCRKQVSFLIRTSWDITIVWHLPHA